jgi:dipeptidyl aminopeptidase/acylaminoacyl peptidase
LESYFAEPSHFAERISPDGKWVAYLGPDDFGINRLWVLRSDNPESLVRVSSSDGPAVTVFFWLSDDAILWQTSTPVGRTRLFLGTPQSSKVREILTDEKRNISLQGVVNSKEPFPLVGLSDGPSAYPDLFRLKLGDNEKPELVCQNRDRIIIWAWNHSGTPVAGLRWNADGAKEILNLRGATSKVIFRAEPTDDARLLFASPDGSSVFVITNRDADLTRVESVDLKTGSRKLIASDPLGRLDVEQVIVHPKDGRLLGAGFIDEPVRWQALDPAFSKLLEVLNSLPDSSRMTCLGFDANLKHCLLRRLSDHDLGKVYLYDVAARKMRLLWREHPEFEQMALCEMKEFNYPARDGCSIPAYLTVPRDGKPPWPLVVFPHGGPRMRTNPGFDGRVQFLASRGYAVLQPNFRGSRGYGKAFMNAGDGQWGKGVMQTDVTDGVDFLVNADKVDKSRIAIFGGSYGGYAALAGLAFTPDHYAAGICLFGVSDLIDHTTHFSIESQPYAGDTVRRLGDPSTATGRALLDDLSPVNHAPSFKAPLLIYHGANDTLIPVSHARRMVDALKQNEKNVEFLLASDDGHGFSNPESEMAVYRAIEVFLHEHLGGKIGPAPAETITRRLAGFRKYHN